MSSKQYQGEIKLDYLSILKYLAYNHLNPKQLLKLKCKQCSSLQQTNLKSPELISNAYALLNLFLSMSLKKKPEQTNSNRKKHKTQLKTWHRPQDNIISFQTPLHSQRDGPSSQTDSVITIGALTKHRSNKKAFHFIPRPNTTPSKEEEHVICWNMDMLELRHSHWAKLEEADSLSVIFF